MPFHVLQGAPVIGLLVLLALIFGGVLVAVVLLYKRRRTKSRTRALLRKYTIREHGDSKVIGTMRNPIQPPSNSYVKVNLVPPKPLPLKRQKLVYDESMDDHLTSEFENDKEILLPYRQERSPSVEKSLNQNKDRFLGWLKNPSKIYDKKIINTDDQVNVESCKIKSENIYTEGFGLIELTLQYSVSEEILTVALISGREIHSADLEDVFKFPAVSIQLEDNDESEVTSNPDDAPHPMYDQEFSFPIPVNMLSGGVLRFTVRDLLYSHEVRIIGFVRVLLRDYESILVRGEVTPLIHGNISMSLTKQPSCLIGEVLVSLFYDCVTDKVVVNVRRLRNLQISKEDKEVYVKISILLDNKVLLSKKTNSFPSSRDILTNKQTFDFNALSGDLDKDSFLQNSQLDTTQELLSYRSKFVNRSPSFRNKRNVPSDGVMDLHPPDSLKNHMGILLSVRAITSNITKRVIGRLYIGKTNKSENEEQIHWREMLKHFDNHITQWHFLRLDRI